MKPTYRTILTTGFLALMALILVACGEAPATASSADARPVIGYVINNMNDTFQTFILNAAEAQAATYGMDVNVVSSNEDLLTQIDQVNNLIQAGVSGLVVVPVDTSGMGPITQAATEAGIPLVFVNRNPFGTNSLPEGVFYVGSQNRDAGIIQARLLGEQLSHGGVAILMGILGDEGAVHRTQGVNETLATYYPNLTVLAEETGQWQRDQAITLTENLISAHGDNLHAILANNDEMALGALQAVRSIGREDIIIVGIDATPDALEEVATGGLAATVFQDAQGQGAGAVTVLNGAITGNPPTEAITWIEFQLVTLDNIADFH